MKLDEPVRLGALKSLQVGELGEFVRPEPCDRVVFLSPKESLFLRLCTTFKPAKQWIECIAQQFNLTAQETAELPPFFEAALASRLLISEASILDALTKSWNAEPTEPIRNVVVPTRERSAELRRLLDDLSRQAQTSERSIHILVSEDSTDPEDIEASRVIVSEFDNRSNTRASHVDRLGRNEYAEVLAKHAGVDREVVRFALLGPDSYTHNIGANRNALMLLTQGPLVLSLDDDIRPQPYEFFGDEGSQVALAGHAADASECWFLDEGQSPARLLRQSELSIFECHEALLGRSTASIAAHSVKADARFDMTDACSHCLSELSTGSKSVTLTYSGYLGHLGIHNVGALLVMLNRSSRERVLAAKQGHKSVLRSAQVIRGSKRRIVSHGGPWTGGCFGFDNRTLFPPFFPVGRGEDGLFGILISTLLPKWSFGHVPAFVEHVPTTMEPRTYDEVSALGRVRLADVVASVLRASPRLSMNSALKPNLAILGCFMTELGSQNQKDFDSCIEQFLLSHGCQMLQFLESVSTADAASGNDAWKHELENVKRQLLTNLKTGEYMVPIDVAQGGDAHVAARRLKEYVRSFGKVLSAWSTIYASARALEGTSVRN